MGVQKIQFVENGYFDIYPHTDFEGPCTCSECCMDIPNGYVPSCGVCNKPLRMHGLCTDCVKTDAGKVYMSEN